MDLRRYAVPIIGFTVALGLTAQSAWAWGEKGHQAVARVAELQLSSKARIAIRELVGSEPISDVKIPNFADHIRGIAFYKTKYPNNDKYHFIDIDVNETGPIDLKQICPQGLCAPAVIQKMLEKLTDPNASHQERREALFFVIHLVGDIHQPLHCATRNDRGGNLLRVTVPDDRHHVTNLHHVWDTNLVEAVLGGLEVLDFANRAVNNASSSDLAKFQKGDLTQWILESHQIARDAAYRNIPVQSGSSVFDLSADYLDDNASVVNTQILKGGARLAKVLNDTFR